MKIFLAGYYGYKNFGDELLLFGLLSYLSSTQAESIESVTIITPDEKRLRSRFDRHELLLTQLSISCKIEFLCRAPWVSDDKTLLVLGGGEVLSDARPFPYNGRTYLPRYAHYFRNKRYMLVGGFGTVLKTGTHSLYSLLLPRARKVVTREATSTAIVSGFTDSVDSFTDFAYEVLDHIKPQTNTNNEEYVILNCNKHIYTPEALTKIEEFYQTHTSEGKKVYFIAGTCGEDSDQEVFALLKENHRDLQYFDRTNKTLQETITFVANAKAGLAARLHILLLLKYYQVPLLPLAYQEKVDRLLDI